VTIAYIAVLLLVSLGSVIFFVSRLRSATPAQRSQMIWAAGGGIAVAATVGLLIALR
jgi:hypothetical protein